jgi:hypothetical protein
MRSAQCSKDVPVVASLSCGKQHAGSCLITTAPFSYRLRSSGPQTSRQDTGSEDSGTGAEVFFTPPVCEETLASLAVLIAGWATGPRGTIQVIEEVPGPLRIEQDYISQEKGRQWQEEDQEVYGQDSQRQQ